MTQQQIAWVARHDWFVADCGNGSIVVLDAYTLNGRLHAEHATFSDFAALRAWAGY